MRTEQLLRQTLDELADTAPHPTRISLERPTRRRPTRTLLLAALAVVAVLAVLVPLVVTRTTAEPADRRVPGYWRMISRVEPPAGWQVSQRSIGPVAEVTRLTRGADATIANPSACQVIVYGRGQAPAALFGPGEATEVAGRPATFAPASAVDPARLLWAYDDDAYALVTCDEEGRPQTDYQVLATATRFDRATDLRLPFRLTDLPKGYRVRTVAEIMTSEGLSAGLQTTDGPGGAPSFSVGVRTTAFDAPGPGLPGVEELTIRGQQATVREDKRAVQLTVTGGYPTVDSNSGSDTRSWLPGERDRVVQVAGHLRFASDLTNPDTWFTAARAVP